CSTTGVLVHARHRVPFPEQLLGGAIRHQHVVPAVEQRRRERVQRIDDLADGVRDRPARALAAQRCRLGQPVQVFPLRPVQPQGAGVDLTSLFQPGVPGDTDACQQRHFLAPQPRSTAPGTGRHAEIARAEPGPPRLQELAELGPPSLTYPPAFAWPPLLARPARPVLPGWPVLRLVRDQGLFPSQNLPLFNLAVTTDIPVMTSGGSL